MQNSNENTYGFHGEGPASKEAKEAAEARERAKMADVAKDLKGTVSKSLSDVKL